MKKRTQSQLRRIGWFTKLHFKICTSQFMVTMLVTPYMSDNCQRNAGFMGVKIRALNTVYACELHL